MTDVTITEPISWISSGANISTLDGRYRIVPKSYFSTGYDLKFGDRVLTSGNSTEQLKAFAQAHSDYNLVRHMSPSIRQLIAEKLQGQNVELVNLISGLHEVCLLKE